MSATRDAGRRARGADGRAAELVIVGSFALVVSGAFLWALVLHDRPPSHRRSSAAQTVAATTTPTVPTAVTLPPPRRYPVVDGGVNLRQGPGTNTAVLGKVAGGAKVQVECRIKGEDVTAGSSTSDQWLRITTIAAPGYVSALYVDIGDDLDNPRRIGLCPG